MTSGDNHHLAYVRSVLTSAATEWGSALAASVRVAQLQEPWALVTASDVISHVNLDEGGLSGAAEAVERCVAYVHGWLQAAPSGVCRILLADEVMVRPSAIPPGFDAPYVSYGDDQLAWYASTGVSKSSVAGVLSSQYPYPGISLVSELPFVPESGQRLDVRTLEAVGHEASAVIVWAWDAEAHLIAPLSQSLERPSSTSQSQ